MEIIKGAKHDRRDRPTGRYAKLDMENELDYLRHGFASEAEREKFLAERAHPSVVAAWRAAGSR